ncbi:uncharacterized protein LOC110918833 [Helianthus annuus]|uniref:uncharacterized protein LOC110918833 n=1 Tax=Helianthus annuus TaxID=4232 RepID=UPI000B8F99E2|nr:uncharacterized protein LOC110918833 [Helianthus annuus]
MDSSSSSDSYDKFVLSSSSDDGAKLILLVVMMVMKAIVEVEVADEGTSQPQPKRRKYIVRERETSNDLLVSDYFSREPTHDKRMFRHRFRMSKNLFLRVSKDLEDTYAFFRQRSDARGNLGFTTWQKVTTALRQLAYSNSSDIMDDYLRMSARVARESLHDFCVFVIELYMKRYLRKPTFSDDMQQILEHYTEYHGLPGMIGSLNCMKWWWEICPTACQGSHTRGYHGMLAMMLKVVASQDLWI